MSAEGLLSVCVVCGALLLGSMCARGAADDDAPVRDIGSRLELLVDDWLIERMEGTELRLHRPTPREVAITFDRPWEGSTCCYVTVFQDGDIFRMYYRGSDYDLATRKATHPEVVCYAESADGIHWTRPNLGLHEFGGSKDNNIIWTGPGCHNFTPFKDDNPDCAPDARYKGFVGAKGGLMPIKSPDGIHWTLMHDDAVITQGAFDSQNLAFWDTLRGRYVDFHRGFRDGVRDIMTCTSEDFITWSEPVWLDYGDAPREHLYTNAITPYFRAPHILMGFPKRFVPNRVAVEHPNPGVSDGLFMTSRDGLNFRRWGEAFIRPGLLKDRWVNRNNMIAWGILVTPAGEPGLPDELSVYATEGYYLPGARLRRYSLRMDGFVSANAGRPGGEFITRPLHFEGRELVLNYRTSAAGGVRVELQDEAGAPLPGFGLEDCDELYGDEIEARVTWQGAGDVSALAGTPLRLRFALVDADVYALRFRP